MVRIGIVGMGYTIGIAKNHIKAYKNVDSAKIVALYDIKKERAEDYKEKFQLGDAVVYSSYEELLENVDAISICTPNAYHVPLSIQAFAKGKHVLCEKPFSNDVASCQKAIEAAKKSGKVNMIGLCYRNVPAFRYIKQLIDEDFFGQIYFARTSQGGGRIANVNVKREWRMDYSLSGPGAMADFGSHMLDITDSLLHEACGPLVEIQALSSCLIKKRDNVDSPVSETVDNDDVALFNAKLANGCLVSYTASRIGCDHTLEIYGEKGYVGFNAERPYEVLIQQKTREQGLGGPKKVEPVPEHYCLLKGEKPEVAFDISFYEEIKGFVEAIEKGTPVETDFARGLYVQQLIAAVEEASKTGKVIPLQ
jgi:predicted dehydrogenase